MMEPTQSFTLNITTNDALKKKTDILKSNKFEHNEVKDNFTHKRNKKFAKKSGKPEESSEKNFKQSSLSKQTSDHEVIHSSIFKSNPEVYPLNVEKQYTVSEPLFSTKSFEGMDLHPHLVACLKQRLNIVRMTKVQENALPVLLNDDDALIKSCTGSGKTLAYAIPIIQNFQKMDPKIQRSDGIRALVIVPTRELALQCFETFSTLTKAFTWIVPGYLIGGEKKKSEKARLRKGINILICTPGRLLDHMDTTACLSLEKISWLVIDEADRLLEQGFGDAVKRIIFKSNKNRQSVLVSATLTKEVENLAGISLSNPVYIDIASQLNDDNSFQDFAIPNNLKQFVVVVPSKLRLPLLSGFIVDNCLKSNFKALIFMCSQSSVDFHYSLFTGVLAGLLQSKNKKCKFFRLHGSMKQEERTEIFRTFRTAKEGVLLCTDVAARGLDVPHLDWIVQYSVPSSPEIYVHRIGRTARIGKKGNSLLFLLPSESKFSHLLAEHKIDFEELSSSKYLSPLLLLSDCFSLKKATAEDCATVLQTNYENEVYSEKDLHESAKEAFASYIQSYSSYPKNIRQVLPFKALHLGHVAKSFCLREAPSKLGWIQSHKRERQFKKKSESKPTKRKFQHSTVSEFDSVLSFTANDSGRKAKKRKKL